MTTSEPVLQIAISTPVNKLFDYLPPSGAASGPNLQPGMRVAVPFGRRELVGVVTRVARTSEVPAEKLKRALHAVDDRPLLDSTLLELLSFASSYYQHPPGEVVAAALPSQLRSGARPEIEREFEWRITAAGEAVDRDALEKKARVQALLLEQLTEAALDADALRTLHSNWRPTVQTLIEKGWVECHEREATPQSFERHTPPELTDAQRHAVESLPTTGYYACLLQGVTGSGKTEVYLQLIEQQLAAGRQSLVLVPEIGLTPQLLRRFRRRLNTRIAVLHSGLTDRERLQNWLAAHNGSAGVVIGTRSAIFTPLPKPGLLIVDEEHDGSFKQQDGFRYSARDLAVWRARQLEIPVVLGSATPALETLHNALNDKYLHLRLPERPGSARQPDIHRIDLRKHPPTDGLSEPLLAAMARHLEAGAQVLVYLNRRGFAPTLLCPECGTVEECQRCDARMVVHQERNKLMCHHCGAERHAAPTCRDCECELVPVGQGTERIEQALKARFPDYPLVRIDRDTTRKRGELERRLEEVRTGEARILIGTQMLTKGHDFPGVTCVGIVDSDQGLFGTDFRSSERLAQSLLQVAGRAGRGDQHGEVWLQSWSPDHPLLEQLLEQGYDGFATAALEERSSAAWPPFSYIALLRAESARRDGLNAFLDQAAQTARALTPGNVRVLGPASAPMEKRGGRFRGQLLIVSESRGQLGAFLRDWRASVANLEGARRTRWSLDVDPFDMF